MRLSTGPASVADESGSTRFQDYTNIVNYIPASFWECDDFNHKVLVLARDLGLKVATEDTNGVFALLGWLHAKGSLAEAKRVSPVQLYNSVRDCKKSFVKLQHFDGVFVRALPRNPMDFKNNWPDVQWSDPYADALVLDPMAEMFVAGCTIDYVTELGGAYLKVINPNATASCGCGESFSV